MLPIFPRLPLSVLVVGLLIGPLLHTPAAAGDGPAPTFTLYSLTTPAAILGAGQGAGQSDPASVGKALVGSIPGGGLEFRQAVEAVSGDTSSGVAATLACPAPSSPAAAFSYSSVKVLNGNRAQVVFCPSPASTSLAALDTGDPTFAPALARFKADRYRSGRDWVGNTAFYNVYFACPDLTHQQAPRLRFRYQPGQHAVAVSFDAGNYRNYCDIVGEYTDGLVVEQRRAGQAFHQVGQPVLRVEGLREVLAWNYGFAPKYRREAVSIPLGGSKLRTGTQIRVRLIESFHGRHRQNFQRFVRGAGTRVPSHRTTYVSRSWTVEASR